MTPTKIIATLVASVAVITLVAAIYMGGTQTKPILNTRTLNPCPPGWDPDDKVLCYPVDSPSP